MCHFRGYGTSKTAKKKIVPRAPWQKITKIATKNRQNRHLAELHNGHYIKLLEDWILSEIVVSYVKIGPQVQILEQL